MTLLWILFVTNTVFAVLPPYGWMTPLNAVAAVGAIAIIIAENSR